MLSSFSSESSVVDHLNDYRRMKRLYLTFQEHHPFPPEADIEIVPPLKKGNQAKAIGKNLVTSTPTVALKTPAPKNLMATTSTYASPSTSVVGFTYAGVQLLLKT